MSYTQPSSSASKSVGSFEGGLARAGSCAAARYSFSSGTLASLRR